MSLHVEFLRSGRSAASLRTARRPADTGLFWWTIAITLLLGAAIASWFFSIYVFSYPERPFNYNLLKRLNKIDLLKTFTLKEVPVGKSYGPKAAFQEFDRLTDKQIEDKNALLLRSYLTNYHATEDKPIYLLGDYKIYQVRPLTELDVFPSGIVVRAQAIEAVEGAPMEFPNTLIEFVFPTKGPALAAFNVGDVLTIDAKSIFAKADAKKTGGRKFAASVINFERLPQHKLLFTVVPLLYGNCEINGDQDAKLTMEPPVRLNLEAKWPITEETAGSSMEPTSVAEALPTK